MATETDLLHPVLLVLCPLILHFVCARMERTATLAVDPAIRSSTTKRAEV